MKNSTCADRLKYILSLKNMKQSELCDLTNIPKSAMSQYVNGSFEPKQDRIWAISRALDISEAWLMGYDVPMEREHRPESQAVDYSIKNVVSLPTLKKIPLLGTIACGTPILAEENIDDYIPLPEKVRADFAVVCQGDSMVGARIMDGDIVMIRKQEDVDDGQIAAILIENSATLKRVYHTGNGVTLVAENSSFPPMVFAESDMVEIHILGKAVAFFSNVK